MNQPPVGPPLPPSISLEECRMPVDWNAENAAHLLRRAGFAATAKDVKKALKKSQAKAVGGLFKRDKKSDKGPKKGFESFRKMQTWWFDRMRTTSSPLIEKLVLFFHNHFATSIDKVGSRDLMHKQNRALRKYCLGRFEDLVLEMCRDPAMIIWLDNKSNKKDAPNENFARELMELFTTGVLDQHGAPNYTEQDVVESARAFTGWTLDDGEFFFADWNHDYDSKTFRGTTGTLDGTDIVANLVADSATARRLAMKLWSYFAYEVDLAHAVVDELEQVYFANDGRIEPMLRHIFLHDDFYSASAKQQRVKSPVEWYVGLMALLGAKVKHDPWSHIPYRLDEMGQSVYQPPSVFGWQEGLGWVETSALLERTQFAEDLTSSRDKDDLLSWSPKKLLGKKKKYKSFDAGETADVLLARLGPLEVAASTRAALVDYLQADSDGLPAEFALDGETIDRKVRGFVSLALSLPEFQVH